jgi:antitoxin CptB
LSRGGRIVKPKTVPVRHARLYAGHPRFFSAHSEVKTWTSGTSPAITLFFVIDPACSAFAPRTATDIGWNERYINPPGTSGLLAFGLESRMTGSIRSSGGLDDRRKRLLFRCWHRGTREMDLILGRFADAEIATLADDELAQLEHLIEVPDPDLYAALTGNVPLAPHYANSLFDRIKFFRPADRDA